MRNLTRSEENRLLCRMAKLDWEEERRARQAQVVFSANFRDARRRAAAMVMWPAFAAAAAALAALIYLMR